MVVIVDPWPKPKDASAQDDQNAECNRCLQHDQYSPQKYAGDRSQLTLPVNIEELRWGNTTAANNKKKPEGAAAGCCSRLLVGYVAAAVPLPAIAAVPEPEAAEPVDEYLLWLDEYEKEYWWDAAELRAFHRAFAGLKDGRFDALVDA